MDRILDGFRDFIQAIREINEKYRLPVSRRRAWSVFLC